MKIAKISIEKVAYMPHMKKEELMAEDLRAYLKDRPGELMAEISHKALNIADSGIWDMPKCKVTITGEKVHDVGYRLSLLEEADVLFIPNFDARNVQIDGKQAIIALAEGDEAQIKEFTDFCRSNFPAEASVGDVSVEGYEGKIRSIDSFRDSLSINQLSKIARVGMTMLDKQDQALGKMDQALDKQDQTLDKQDQTLDKQDQMLDKQDQMLDKQDQMLDKQDQTLGKQDQMLDKQDQMLDKQDQTLGKQDQMLDKQDQTLGKQDQMLDKQDQMLDKQDELKTSMENGFSELKGITEHGFSELKGITEHGFSELKTSTDRGFGELKEEHIKTREMSMEIFHSEVQGLRQEINSLRSSVEEIRKKVGIA